MNHIHSSLLWAVVGLSVAPLIGCGEAEEVSQEAYEASPDKAIAILAEAQPEHDPEPTPAPEPAPERSGPTPTPTPEPGPAAPIPTLEPAPELTPPPPPRDPIWAWDQPRDAISKNYPSTLLFGISYQLSEQMLVERLATYRGIAPSDRDSATKTGWIEDAPAERYRYLGLEIQCAPPDVLDCGTEERGEYKNVLRDPMIWQRPVSARENVNGRGQIIINVFGKRTLDDQPEPLETIPPVEIPIAIERDPLWLTVMNWIVEHWAALAGIGAAIGGAVGGLATILRKTKKV